MSRESTRLLIALGIVAGLTAVLLLYLSKRDELASNHYYHQAIGECETKIDNEPCIARVEKQHERCFASFVDREGDVEGYARCMGMTGTEFEAR